MESAPPGAWKPKPLGCDPAGTMTMQFSEESKDTLYDRIGGHGGLKTFLTRFYADVRQHAVIGPIFQSRIQDWPAHIEKIAGFWSGLTGGPQAYGGGLMARHMPLGLSAEHFGHWLTLWSFHCDCHLSPKDAEMFKALAQQIGARLRQHLVGT